MTFRIGENFLVAVMQHMAVCDLISETDNIESFPGLSHAGCIAMSRSDLSFVPVA